MKDIEQKILLSFKKNSASELSTSELLSSIDPYYAELETKITTEHDREKLLEYKREKAKLHRRILWHLNNLVKKGLLRVNKYVEKGKKVFALNIADNEEIITELLPSKAEANNNIYKKRIVLAKPTIPAFPIDGFEQKEILFKFEPATFVDRLNSLVVFGEKFKSLHKLYEAISSLFSNINDALCIIDFDYFFSSETLESLCSFIEKINSDCEDYGKKISLIINISNLQNQNLFFDFINFCEKKQFENVNLIFETDGREIQEEARALFDRLILMFSKTKTSLCIKNKNVCNAPYFFGRAGPYCIDEKEWKLYFDRLKENKILACTQSSVIVDIDRFISEYGLTTEKFVDVVMNITKALLFANSLQRRHSEEYFRNIVSLNYPKSTEFLIVARNYIRLWNYNLSAEEQEKLLTIISIARKKVDEFCAAEETIYKSCGMPTRFRVALACAFKEASLRLSEEVYQKLEVKGLDDLNKKEIKKDLRARELLCNIFDGGNRVSFYRTGKIDVEEILHELAFLLNSYNIPLLIYNFKHISGDLKLSLFFR
ncbi:MAG: hypothetical protein QXQ82_00025 [Candidatus Pacearchaeota archaeon]